ncbi:uncharacterized protein LOC116017719 [Ipomoea triloba]|uniref:uncharacterized protein LOC116017719 n=1 Tax=Ipomoea triloba TaxID=35885 RepID=UPI00125E9DFC|nr:uncharacterized protein LOC116017719 [Ipomoea triloba]
MESCISNNAESRSPSPPPRHGRTLFHEFEEEEEEGVCYSNGFGWFKNEEREDPWETMKAKKKKKKQVFLEGYVETSDEDELGRTKSLTDDDLEELKGCLDLGFGFNYEEIPELRNTLPALELCYSMTQKYLDDHQKSPESMSDTASTSSASNPIANWKISSPGDDPEDVKARLKYWAQAVACTVRLCN